MLKQRAVMPNEPQDRMLNMHCSGMLPPTLRQPTAGMRLMLGPMRVPFPCQKA
ncbi:hypothetical protein [Paenibacillus thiaminolyticus]|uniref:hypothetical protein n=1 Tax=Paenibacillus thiaminolyticus TaxID=49283 RepID=UPI0015FF938B|nr:hypothetical protein [Paenibacillus thiaminolyticus]